MSGIVAFIKRHAVATYFALAYAVAWGSILLIVGPANVGRGSVPTPQFLLIWLAMLAASGGVGVLLTAIVDGRAGLAKLWAGMTRWRVGLRWYAPLLIVVTIASVVLAFLARTSPGYVPAVFTQGNQALLVAMLFIASLGAAIEELGWTGFATTKLSTRYTPLVVGLIVGLAWAAWHFMGDLVGSRSIYGELFPLHFVVFWLIPLTALRLLIVWLYDHTQSLLLAQLMHASYTAVLIVLQPTALTPTQQMTYETLFTAALCLVVAIIVIADRQRLMRPRSARLAVVPAK